MRYQEGDIFIIPTEGKFAICILAIMEAYYDFLKEAKLYENHQNKSERQKK
ncbi:MULTISPECIES: hypothetical protein [Shewanella]|nr:MULTISPECIES: hypothetical protein [Shewanella]MCB2380653.1 hypothetical protein [Shewanella sp. SR1]